MLGVIYYGSKENIGEVIKYTYNYNDNGYNYYNILSENNVIGENIVIPSNTSYTYKMKFWISDKADSSYMGKTFSAKILNVITVRSAR